MRTNSQSDHSRISHIESIGSTGILIWSNCGRQCGHAQGDHSTGPLTRHTSGD